jgi:hypothetical protein
MLIRHSLARASLAALRSPAGDGEGGAGGGGGSAITPEVQALIDAAVAAEVKGLKAKNGELLAAQAGLKTKLATFDGIDPDAVRNILKRFSDDEEAAMIAKGEIDKVLEKRTERMRTDFERQLNETRTAGEGAAKRAKAYEARVLDDAVRAAAAKAGLHQHAVEDALLAARTMFSLDDSGTAVQLGEDGKPVLGKDGKSPFSPAEWLESLKPTKPHWFPANASGGGAGGNKGNGSAHTKNAREMTTAEKAAYIKEFGNEKWSSKVNADYSAPAKAA